MAVEYYKCDECNEWGMCVLDISGHIHTVERHVSTEDLSAMFTRRKNPWATSPFGEAQLMRLAREGRLKSQDVCGTWIRTALKDLI